MSKTSTATKKTEDTPDFPAGKKQENMAEIMEALRPIPTVESGRFGLAQHARNIFHYHAIAESQIEDYLVPAFWVPVAAKLSPLCRIEIVEETGQWFSEVIVRSVGAEGVDLALLNYVKIGGVSAIGSKADWQDGMRISYGGQYKRWGVFRDTQELISNLPTEQAAISWLETSNHCGSAA